MWLKKIENTVLRTYIINELNGEKIVARFYEKELKKKNQTEFIIVKVTEGKGDEVYLKWKGYNNSFNS